MLTFRNFILFLSTVTLFVSCAFVKDHTGGNGMAKVRRAERLFNRQEYEHAVSLCNDVINNGGKEEVMRAAKLQLARIYFETRQFDKTISLYDELLYKPGSDVLVNDVTNYMDLLKRTGSVLKAREVAETYAKNYKNNARFTNLQESLTNYYTFFNRDSMRNVRVDSLRLNLPGYQYGLALYNDNIVFLSNDFKKNDAQSFYTNSKLYMVSEDGVEPFSKSLKGVLQVGPASFFDHGKKVIYTSNRFDAVKNEKNSYINYNNNTQLLLATYQPEHDNWSKPVPVKIGKNADNYSFLHPSVAPNGKRLYFASDMPGGYGGTDIYYTDWDKEEKRWKAPVNMGSAVNTNGNELYPFVSGDQLFFSSNGLQGFGGQDIFVFNVKKPEEGVVHLPYPVNTQFDDLNPVLDVSKRLLYFTSDRSGVHDNDHIYVLNLKKNPLKQLDLPDPGKPLKDDDKVPYTMNQTDDRRQQTLAGDKRYDNISNDSVQQPLLVPVKRVAEAVIANNERTVKDYADEPVNSSPEIIPWQNTVNAVARPTAAAAAQAAPAAFSDGRSTNTAPDRIGWYQQGSPNPATQKGDSLAKVAGVLWHIPGVIYFDLNSYVPQDQEWRKLDSIFQVWKAHPRRLILINGHTDVIGAEKYNLALKSRAVYIQECLRSRGVDPDRIRVNYYGSTKPVMIAKQYSLAADRELFIKLQGVNRRCEVRIF